MPTQRREEKRVEERASTRERDNEHFGSSFYVSSSPWACPMQIGLSQSAVCSTWGLHPGPRTFLCSIFAGFSLPCLLATAILNSFSLFYLPNIPYTKLFLRVHFSQTLSLSVPITVIFDPKKPLVSQAYFLFPSQNATSFLLPFLPKQTGGQITQSKLCTD